MQAAFTRVLTWEIWTPRFWQFSYSRWHIYKENWLSDPGWGFCVRWLCHINISVARPRPVPPVISPGLSISQDNIYTEKYFFLNTSQKHLAHLLMNVKDGIGPGMFDNCVHLLPGPERGWPGHKPDKHRPRITDMRHCWSKTHLNINVQNTKFRAECVTNTIHLWTWAPRIEPS